MPVEAQLSHRNVRAANLPYVSLLSPTETSPCYIPGSQDILTSINGYAERRPGFANVDSTGFNNLQRVFPWDRTDGSFYKMYCDINASAQAQVFKFAVGVDVAPVSIYTDTGSSTPFDFVVSNNTVYFSNGHVAKKWDPVNGVSNWGISIGSVNNATGPNGVGTGANASGGTWASPGNITAADAAYSTVTVTGVASGVVSSAGYLEGTNCGFGLASSSTVTGIQVDVKGWVTGPSTVSRPTTQQNDVLGTGNPFANPGNAYDNNLATFATATDSNVLQEPAECIWQGLPAGPANPQSLVLSIKSSATKTGTGSPHAQVAYSLNNGSTWTFVYNSTVSVAVNTATITLPVNQDLTKVKVQATAAADPAVSNSMNVQMYEIFVTVTTGSNVSNATLTATMLKNGNPVGTSKTLQMPASNSFINYGGTGDLWSGTWTFNDPNQSTFGVALVANVTNLAQAFTFSIDYVQITIFGVGGPTVTVSGAAGTMTVTQGLEYVFCYGNSNTGHVSSPTPVSSSTGAFANKANVSIALTASTDPQVNQIRVFRSTDSAAPGITAGTFFEIPTSPYPNTTQNVTDLAADSALNPYAIAPLPGFNDPPTPGRCPVYFSGRIWLFAGNRVNFSGLEETTIGVPEESFVSGLAGNFWAFDQPMQALAVAGSANGQTLLNFCGGRLYGIVGNSLDTFRRFLISNRRGCRNVTAVTSLGGLVAWFDSSGQVWGTDGTGLNEIGTHIRPDTVGIAPANVSMTFHVAGRFHWLVLSTGAQLFIYDMDTDQWMPPWSFACNYVYSGETSAGNYQLFGAQPSQALTMSTTAHNDNGATYQSIGRTNLFAVVPDFGTRFSTVAAGMYDEPSRTGLPWYFQVDTNSVSLTDVAFLADDDPLNALSVYKSIFSQATTTAAAFNRNNGTYLVQNVYAMTQPTARWIGWQWTAANADDALRVYGFYMAYSQKR